MSGRGLQKPLPDFLFFRFSKAGIGKESWAVEWE